jgi:hypothetical protein
MAAMTTADARQTVGPDDPADSTLGLSLPPVATEGGRRVEVAVDAPGAGGRRYTYEVPDRLTDLQDGEAVLVEFGRRQALGVVLGPAVDMPGIVTKPILDRIRADGPLLPPLALALAGRIATTYLAPPAAVIRAMLPPGILERLELVAERRPDGSDEIDGADRALLAQLTGGPLAVRDLAAPEGKAGLLRRLRPCSRRPAGPATSGGSRRPRPGGRPSPCSGPPGVRRGGRWAHARSPCSRSWSARSSRVCRPRSCPVGTEPGQSPAWFAGAWSRPRSGSGRDCRSGHGRPGPAAGARHPPR